MSKLVIQASDIPIPGFTQKSVDPVNQSGATGVTASFANADGSREVGDTIVVFPDENAAAMALQAATTAAQGQLAGVAGTPVQVGTKGTVFSGTDSGKAATVLIFQQGKSFVVMQFNSAANDPVPADLVTSVGQKQDELIKAGLPS